MEGEAGLGESYGVCGGKAKEGEGWGVRVLGISTLDSWVLDGDVGLGGEIGASWGCLFLWLVFLVGAEI